MVVPKMGYQKCPIFWHDIINYKCVAMHSQLSWNACGPETHWLDSPANITVTWEEWTEAIVSEQKSWLVVTLGNILLKSKHTFELPGDSVRIRLSSASGNAKFLGWQFQYFGYWCVLDMTWSLEGSFIEIWFLAGGQNQGAFWLYMDVFIIWWHYWELVGGEAQLVEGMWFWRVFVLAIFPSLLCFYLPWDKRVHFMFPPWCSALAWCRSHSGKVTIDRNPENWASPCSLVSLHLLW